MRDYRLHRKAIERIVAGILGAATLAACSHVAGPSPLPAALGARFAVRPDAGAFKVLYAFKGFPDAASPAAGMTALNGTLYGTTQIGGKGNAGTVFSTTTAGRERVLHSFGSGGPDGVLPEAGLTILGGSFYGTAASGGTNGFGAVFKIDKAGNEHLVYSFKGGKDGAAPYTGLAVSGGALYGTTLNGGNSACPQGCGTVFEVTAAGKEHVVYAFKGGSDGIGPLGKLIVVSSALYGTTADGGKDGLGTVFKTSTSGNEQVVYSFKNDGADGGEPESGLISLGGKLYGTTNGGGKNGDGTVYSVTAAGSEHVVYSFKGGSDGANPEANVIAIKSELYGTTAGGGSSNAGTVFGVSTSGNERVVHAFKPGEGSDPRAPLVVVGGALYGTTSLSGPNGVGTIFKVTP